MKLELREPVKFAGALELKEDFMILGYLRVSTRKQSNEGYGLDVQEESIRTFCARSFPNIPIKFYRDEGISGVVPFEDREDGAKLINDVQAGDVVISKDPSRFGRKCYICVNLLEKLESIGATLGNSLSGNIVKDADSKFTFHLFAGLAEKDYAMLVSNMEEGKKIKAEKGGNIGGGVPFYMESSNKGDHYEPTEAGIKKLGELIKMFDNNIMQKTIAELLGFSPATVSKYKKLYKSGIIQDDYNKHKREL